MEFPATASPREDDDSCITVDVREGRSMVDRSHDRVRAAVDRLLDDPLTRLAMQADGVDRETMRTLLVKASLAAPAQRRAAPTGYRPGVGIVLFNRDGRVFMGRRIDTDHEAWQMPQGGIDPDESPREAALREVREELGTDKVEIIGEAPDLLSYDLPAHLVGVAWGGEWRGQRQRWFAMRFLGLDADINVATDHPEFSDWRWVDLEDLATLIVAFKRDVYHQVAARFAKARDDAAARNVEAAHPV
jgi:putative (di)nucleoside polyphosphate hydrolase